MRKATSLYQYPEKRVEEGIKRYPDRREERISERIFVVFLLPRSPVFGFNSEVHGWIR
jgi:hypothetical protein